ncbi:MAG: hypothetical protein DRI24_03300 [Deltaproteobacteria bacterium]|nr:MAG: hypothetical protein DRI24_03300 [Deltaproteobacteria bacterium]
MRIPGRAELKINGLQVAVWMMIFLPLLAWPVCAKINSKPSAPKLLMSVDRSTAKVGDFLWLSLKYNLPEGANLPEKVDVKGIETLTVVNQVVQDNEIRINFQIDQLETFDVGPVGLTYLDKDGDDHFIEAKPVTITVESNLGEKPETSTLRPIQDIISTESRFWPYLIWGTVAILLLGTLVFGLWWYKKRSVGKTAEKMVEPPHVRAERELDRLLADRQFADGDVKQFYFRFSEIIRQYMEAIRPFPAAELTTEEIVRRCRNIPQDQQIVHLLRHADLVKFANALPTPQRKDQDIRETREYIRQTHPEPSSDVQAGNEADK